MKRILLSCLALACLFASNLPAANKQPAGFKHLEIGERAPDFSLKGVDGKRYTLDSFKRPKVLMILFTGTHCPVSHAIEKRL